MAMKTLTKNKIYIYPSCLTDEISIACTANNRHLSSSCLLRHAKITEYKILMARLEAFPCVATFLSLFGSGGGRFVFCCFFFGGAGCFCFCLGLKLLLFLLLF